jgi:choline monooxygenase
MALSIDPDIRRARTLDSAFYRDQSIYDRVRERVFVRSWQWLGDLTDVAPHGSLAPRALLPGLLDEPLLLARDGGGTLRCLSNVCTHRGNILIAAPCRAEQIRCGYHSRRFDLAGRMLFMPEFALAHDFPSDADHLPELAFTQWQGHGFVSLAPHAPLEPLLSELNVRMPVQALESLSEDPAARRDYDVAAHWALYVENYLEGLHIPFVHPALNEAVEFASYRHELFRFSNLQVALAKDGEDAFKPSTDGPERGTRVAAYYWWIFPNLMLNFYPWGVSVNLVQPMGPDSTRVSFRSYVGDAARRQGGAGAALDQVELEDERIVEAVHKGVRSRLYRSGRYSPTREQGVHHFHRLLCEFLE